MRHHAIHKTPGAHLVREQRETPANAWNRLVREGRRPTLRGFARAHGIAYSTWRREFVRGKVAETVPDPRRPDRRQYAEYDPAAAQAATDAATSGRGPRMAVTNRLAAEFAALVKGGRRSPHDAVRIMRERRPGARVPCARTWYVHVAHGDLPVKYGETPYHPDRRRPKRPRPHPARTAPGRLGIADRPAAADARSEPGHFEMDAVVSRLGGAGALLVLVDRMTRELAVERMPTLCQRQVRLALARMRRRGAAAGARSVTTDNGCEFPGPEAIGRELGCDVHYTRAYASWEKGSVENCSRLVRRWYPKGTDFSKCTRAEVAALERWVNSIHRPSLGGLTSAEFGAAARAAAAGRAAAGGGDARGGTRNANEKKERA